MRVHASDANPNNAGVLGLRTTVFPSTRKSFAAATKTGRHSFLHCSYKVAADLAPADAVIVVAVIVSAM
jgi:hypothetical protein